MFAAGVAGGDRGSIRNEVALEVDGRVVRAGRGGGDMLPNSSGGVSKSQSQMERTRVNFFGEDRANSV